MKLDKLSIEDLKGFELHSKQRIMGGGTCLGTCCPGDGTGCEDWESDGDGPPAT